MYIYKCVLGMMSGCSYAQWWLILYHMDGISAAQRVLWMALATACGPMTCQAVLKTSNVTMVRTCLGPADMDNMVLWGDFNPVIGI